jgi:Trk-type K+ transport system membrane component
MVISTVSQIVMIFGSSIFGAIYDEFIAKASTAAKHGFTTFTMLLVLIAISALAFVTYTVTRKKLECKLNLE